MLCRRALAVAFAVVAGMTMASATSLGSLTSTSIWGTAGETEPCSVPDPSTDVVLIDETGSTIDLLTGLVGSTVSEVELTNFVGHCVGMRPVVIVIGHDGLTATKSVLSRTELGSIVSGESSPVIRAVDEIADEINTLLDLLDQPTEVRVGFCPDAVPHCGVAPWPG